MKATLFSKRITHFAGDLRHAFGPSIGALLALDDRCRVHELSSKVVSLREKKKDVTLDFATA
jgi:hypothetical protein